MQIEQFLSSVEAGVYLGGALQPIAYQTLANWRSLGCGPLFHRLNGRAVRYRREDLDEWLAQQGRYSSTAAVAARSSGQVATADSATAKAVA